MANIDNTKLASDDVELKFGNEVILEGEPLPDSEFAPKEVPVKVLDHFDGPEVDGNPVDENTYDGYCDEVRKRQLRDIDKARYQLMSNLINDPTTLETEVDGLRVRRMSAGQMIQMSQYFNEVRAATENTFKTLFVPKVR